MMLWALIIDIYERQTYPVVQHVFYGRTEAEAQGYYEAHLRTDAFLRGCAERGRWQNVECTAKMRWERVQVPT